MLKQNFLYILEEDKSGGLCVIVDCVSGIFKIHIGMKVTNGSVNVSFLKSSLF